MKVLPKYLDLERFQITPRQVVNLAFGCEPEQILRRVILMPSWKAAIFSEAAASIKEITPEVVYEITAQGQQFTLIRSGIGAPQTGDNVLALGCTPCEMMLFAGSAGGLDVDMQIGNLLVVDRSICGDGFSRYLDQNLVPVDCFQQPAFSDPGLTSSLQGHVQAACLPTSIPFHRGAVFSTDSILTQFFRLEYFSRDLGCAAIEMETAACFNAARLAGIRAAALLLISDLPGREKTLFSGREDQERERYRSIRRDVLTRILIDTLLQY